MSKLLTWLKIGFTAILAILQLPCSRFVYELMAVNPDLADVLIFIYDFCAEFYWVVDALLIISSVL